jgi:hypothetical protein
MASKKLSEVAYRRILQKCKNLPPSKGNYLCNDFMENLFLTVLDFQMQGSVVEKAINNYRRNTRREIPDFARLKNLLSQYPDTKEGNLWVAQYLWRYNHWKRVELLRKFVTYLEANGVTNQDQLKDWAAKADFENDFKGRIKGAGLAIFKWLVMRQGVETIKPDTWVHRFIEDTIGYPVTNEAAIETLEQIAKEIDVKAYELDWRIWEHQSGR